MSATPTPPTPPTPSGAPGAPAMPAMPDASQPLNLQPVAAPPRRRAPSLAGWRTTYVPAARADLNLLVMFHGLGDNMRSFAELANKMQLPYTAVLVVEGQIPVPLIPNAYMYYPAFDGMFNPLPAPDVGGVLPRFRALLAALLAQGWAPANVHLFGWQHGATLALELAYAVGREPLDNGVSRLGSVTAVCGAMASRPERAHHFATPCCFFTRSGPATDAAQRDERAVERAFTPTAVVRAEAGRGPDMPRSTDEWAGIMRFWGQVMEKPIAQNMEGVYEVKQ